MSVLAGLTTNDEVQEVKDSVGGNFSAVESGLYKTIIKSAYVDVVTSGAVAIRLEVESDNGDTIRQALWVQSNTQKGGKNYFVDKKGNKQYLPGFNQANALCLLTAGKAISEMATEEKIIDIYDFASKSQVPTKVDMLVELLGQPIVVGIIKQTVNKNIKDEATGKYVATNETRTENEVDKFFRAKDNLTVTEIKAGMVEAVFITKWHEKNTGVTRDKTKKVTASANKPAPEQAALFA